MADAAPKPSEFQKLRELADKNGCDVSFRAETGYDQVFCSLMATQRSDGRRVYDLRPAYAWDSAETALTDTAKQAQAEWWNG